MTSKQRRQYLVLHAVREQVRGMAEHWSQWPRKTKQSIARIEARTSTMLEALGKPTYADMRAFGDAARKLRTAWNGEGENCTPAAFVAISLALVADCRAAIPAKAARVREEFATLEGMLATLYQHFDPEMTDAHAADEGESIATEYRAIVAA